MSEYQYRCGHFKVRSTPHPWSSSSIAVGLAHSVLTPRRLKSEIGEGHRSTQKGCLYRTELRRCLRLLSITNGSPTGDPEDRLGN